MADNSVSLKVDSDQVEAQHLLKAFAAFLKVVTGATGVGSSDWLAQVEEGSQVLRLTASQSLQPGELDCTEFFRGLTAFNYPELQAPPDGFTPDVMRHLQDLGSVAEQTSGPLSIFVGVDQRVNITREFTSTVKRVSERGYADTGSLEGTLDALNVHGKYTFSLYRFGPFRKVKVYFSEGDFEHVRSAVKRRVTVHGEIRYDLAHRVKGMTMDWLEVMPSQDEVPSIAEITGILRRYE